MFLWGKVIIKHKRWRKSLKDNIKTKEKEGNITEALSYCRVKLKTKTKPI